MAPKAKIKSCSRCGTLFKLRRSKYCSWECGKIVSAEIREKISISRKKFLAENPDKHPWSKSEKFKSVPCQELKRKLAHAGISFVEEYKALDDRSFLIDIAFPKEKLAIEINGNQHYQSNGKLKAYYQNRHDLLTNAGWTVIELPCQLVWREDVLRKIFSGNIPKIDYSDFVKQRNTEKIKRMQPKVLGEFQKLKNDLKWEPYKQKIQNSGIDFSKFGWVKQVSLLLNICPQSVSRWMRRYLPKEYSTAFTRKSHRIPG